MAVNLLDDLASIRSLDPQNQFAMVASLADQVRQAYQLGCSAIEHGGGEVGGVAVVGMGGSAIGGDLIAAAYNGSLGGPIATVRGYQLPRWLTSRSLVFAVSHSGNTEETVSCLQEALERGCQVICLSSGGKIARIAAERGLPHIEIPGDLQPRAAMGYLSIPIAACLESLGLVEGVEQDVAETAALLTDLSQLYGPERPLAQNPAKQLALDLQGKIPVIYGCELTAVAARRWKCQINENAKSLAFYNEFPELNHNEIVGWQYPSAALDAFKIIYLSDGLIHPQNKKRLQATKELLSADVGDIPEFFSSGRSPLTRLFSSIYLGDYLSLYLAVLYEVDPSPVVRIEDLKRRLV